MNALKRTSIFALLVFGTFLVGLSSTALAADDEGGGSTTETFKLDPAHSDVMVRASHVDVGYVFVEFLDFSGTVEYNEENPSENAVSIEVDATSVETHQKKRNKHLKSSDFLNVKKHPELTFESTGVEKAGDGTFEVTGDLTLAGTTKSITIDVKEIGSGKGPEGKFRRGFYTEFELNRLDFGVDWKPSVVGKNIRVILSFETIKQ